MSRYPSARPYDSDGLRTRHNHEFMRDPAFIQAYKRGMKAAGRDYFWYWRVHILLWAARHASHLPGDFVECGVNRGFGSSAIMEHLDWDRLGRTFWLLDTFEGIVPELTSELERQEGILEKNRKLIEVGFYTTDFDKVRENFSDWKNVALIKGAVPDTLPQVKAETIAFLHLDMNCAPPEIAAAEYFWPRLSPGAPMVMDDYAYDGYRPQKLALDEFAARHGVMIASLPTGQGLLIKP